MTFFEIENLRSVMGAKWLRRPSDVAFKLTLTGVGIDTREDLSGRAFIAIKGQSHDGHAFVQQAVEAGARLLIVEREPIPSLNEQRLPSQVGVLIVDDTRRALSKLALAYRRTLRGTRVIAVTGSSGKTTTKRLIDGVLSTLMQGTSSPKSFNNDIGLPLTILSARLSDKYLVVEIGMNAPGEIAQLAAIAEPDIAVITMIGRAHLEGLGSVEAIAREKASILNHIQPNGVAVVNADVPLLRPHVRLIKTKVLFGESDDADIRLTSRGLASTAEHAAGNLQWFEINHRQRFQLALPGKHNAMNALAAVAVGRRLGLDDDAITAGLRTVKPEAMRMTPIHFGGMTIYNDAYNANPDAMIAALNTFAELTPDALRRVVILGDMLELGAASPELHREVGRHILNVDSQTAIHHAVFVGEQSAFAAADVSRTWTNNRITVATSLDAASMDMILGVLRPGDSILLKASRGMGLERLTERMMQSVQPTSIHRPAATGSPAQRIIEAAVSSSGSGQRSASTHVPPRTAIRS